MTISIRRGVFETNSSSTHSLTMCSKDKKFVTKDELIEILTNSKYPPEVDISAMDNDDFEDWLREDIGNMTYDQYTGDADTEEEEYTTPSGDVVVGISIYSYD